MWKHIAVLQIQLVVWPGLAAAQLPAEGSDMHLGVSECAGGPCHGSAAPTSKAVHQNEHTVWLRAKQHSSAYKTLLSERSISIARNLGLREPAHQSAMCLDCHSDNAKARGPMHRLEEGVGCEACHGGAKRWLKTHTLPTRKHTENLADGMYATDDPQARAELCVSCHVGKEGKFVTHRMLGAGHPRLSFELDSFGLYQPPHFEVDADYRARGKQSVSNIVTWAIGQAVIARERLALLADSKRNREGIWPEFAAMDCYTCHHTIGERRRPVPSSSGLAAHAGTPRVNDSALLMVSYASAAIDGKSNSEIRRGIKELHAAVSRGSGSVSETAARLQKTIHLLEADLQRWSPDLATTRKIFARLMDDVDSRVFRDYSAAEQAMQAVQVVIDTLHAIEPYPPDQLVRINQALDSLSAAVNQPDRFSPRQFEKALHLVHDSLSSS